jgi:hypothetical protein
MDRRLNLRRENKPANQVILNGADAAERLAGVADKLKSKVGLRG